MKLFVSATSPFARKVRIVAREKGLMSRIEEIARVPVESAADLVAVNPLSQIPALLDDDAVAWSDSGLISARLEALGTGPTLLPDYGTDAYWQVRRIEIAAAGLNEMMARIVYENRRPENERSAYWLERWENNLRRSFEQVEAICPSGDVFNMGSLSLGVAATFCDFRLSRIDWRSLSPRLALLQTALEKRPSFIDTYPK